MDRATHTVEQLVTLARLEPELTSTHAYLAELNLAALLQNHAAQYGDEIDTKSINFELQTDPDLDIAGIEVALSVLIRNLRDNAVRYTPSGGERCELKYRQQRPASAGLSERSYLRPLYTRARRD